MGLGMIKSQKILKKGKAKVFKVRRGKNCFSNALPKAFLKMQHVLVVKGWIHPFWYPEQRPTTLSWLTRVLPCFE